ncbi:hypothetical protein AK812_SmicGene21954 [Symbiodinium microadriaticum]|uniref:Uncharacterized protein n=1 Tax=Symbiodinium microadriaticum TaxID=2951 RepID=A0A1Q9DL59_SYMMI|nr:hypothetical protein AK812_SmicGene21954 [Symbiodinium microadriaticum]
MFNESTRQVSMSELVRQNDLCPAVCEFICNIITGSCDGSEPCFSKELWLRRFLELSPWRVKKEVLSQGSRFVGYVKACHPTVISRYSSHIFARSQERAAIALLSLDNDKLYIQLPSFNLSSKKGTVVSSIRAIGKDPAPITKSIYQRCPFASVQLGSTCDTLARTAPCKPSACGHCLVISFKEMFGAVLSALARWFLPSRKQEGREAEEEPATPAERQPAPPSQTQVIASTNEVLPTAPAVPREAHVQDTKELSRPSLSEAAEVSPKEPASASGALAEVANLREREVVQTLDTSDQQPPTSALQQTQPSASPEPACAAPTLRAAPPAQQSLPAEEPSRPAFQSTELADGSFETKLEVVKEADTLYLRLLPVFGDARRSPDDDIEASKSATLQRKLDKAKEVSSKSATLQKKLKEAKAGRAASPARAEAQPVAASSESSAATTVSKTAILQKKLDEARRSVLLKTAAEEVPDKAMQANEDVEMQESLEESTFKMKTGDEAAIKATSSRPSSPDKQDNMEARVADMMELQEAAKSRRRGVVEKAKSVNQGEGSSASRREKRTADDMEETRTPKKKRDEETKGQEEPRQVRRASLFLKGAKKMTAGSAPQKQAVESESTDHGKDAPARERGARPKAWSKPAAQDDVSLDTGAEERPFNVFRAKVDVSDGFADSGKPKTQPQSKPPDFKEKESEESDSSPSEPSRWRAHSEHSEQDDPELRDWRWLQQPTQAPAPRSASEEEMAADATNQALKSKKKKRRRKAKGAASSATKSVKSTALSEPAPPSASKKDRPKRKRRKSHVEKEETTPPKGKRMASPEGTTPKRDRSDFSVQQELGQETSGEVRGAEDIMSVSSGSDNTDYGVIDCRFISENDAALGLRRRIQRHKTRALEEAKKDEKKARKKAKKAAKRALKAKRNAERRTRQRQLLAAGILCMLMFEHI